jgi:hypothetical protein
METWNLNSLIILKCTLNDKLKPRYGLSSWEFHKNNRDEEPYLKLLVSWELLFPMMRYKKSNPLLNMQELLWIWIYKRLSWLRGKDLH